MTRRATTTGDDAVMPADPLELRHVDPDNGRAADSLQGEDDAGLELNDQHSPTPRARRKARLRPKSGWLLNRLGLVAADLLAVTAGVAIARVTGISAVMTVVLVAVAAVSTGSPLRAGTPRVSNHFVALTSRTMLVAGLLALVRPGSGEPLEFLRAGLYALALLLIVRGVVYMSLRALRRRRIGLETAVIVGAGRIGTSVAKALLNNPEYGLVPVGFVDHTFSYEELPLPMLGHPDRLPDLMRDHDVGHVVVAYGGAREAEIVPLLRDWKWLRGEIYIVPRFFDLGRENHPGRTVDIRGYPLTRLRAPARFQLMWPLKRTFDIVASGLLLALVSPALVISALVVKLSSPGPVFFRQKRVGQDGRTFEIFKLRTMRVNNDSDTTWTVEHDDRVIWGGKVLRRTHLDELPQLFNVLRGDMSIVGPRPERPYFVDRFRVDINDYEDRHRVPVGITGWAQIHGLYGNTSIEERARFDNRYIEDWSLARDFTILLRTIPTVLKRRRRKS